MKQDKDKSEEIPNIDENVSEGEINEDLESVLESKLKEIQELSTQVLRLQADFINFRKRTEKEKEKTFTYAVESFACNLLPIIDNFQRAMESEQDKDNGFYKGIEMIYKQLIKMLNDEGIDEIMSLGEEFDPNCHHAVFMEDSDEYEPGRVTEVIQKGYKLKEKVIRPTMVKVSK